MRSSLDNQGGTDQGALELVEHCGIIDMAACLRASNQSSNQVDCNTKSCTHRFQPMSVFPSLLLIRGPPTCSLCL